MQRKIVTGVLIVCLALAPQTVSRAEGDDHVLIEAACVILGSVIVVGGCWMGYKIYRMAKDKLYPPPRVPTNAVPSLHLSATTDKHMGDVASNEGVIYNIDMTKLTADEKADNVLPDGSQATRYAIVAVKGSDDLQTWTASSPIEIWFSPSWYVVRYRGFVETGRNSVTNTATGEMSMRPVTVDTEQPIAPARAFKM